MIAKQRAGEKAAEFVSDGMIVGLGTGSTVTFTIKKIAERIHQGLRITAVSTSSATSRLAHELNIPTVSINEVSSIDLTIDGADEIDPDFNGIKGGGGALLFEKIVANASKKNIWVVDSSKMVNVLGTFPIPVEIVPFGYIHTLKKLAQYNPVLRMKGNTIYETDSKHYIVDLHLKKIEDAKALDFALCNIPGVIETGLFINIVNTIVKATDTEVFVINK